MADRFNGVLETQPVSTQLDSASATNGSATPTKSILVGGDDGSNIKAYKAARVSTANSTLTPLSSNGTFTGTWEDTLGYASIIVTGLVSHNSATNGAQIQFATDSAGVNVADIDENTIVATGEALTFVLTPSARYFRIVYTNGSTAQTSFLLTTTLLPNAPAGPIVPIGSTIKPTDSSVLTRATLAIQNNSGTALQNVSATTNGNIPFSIAEATADVPIKAPTGLFFGQQSITTTSSQVTSAATGRRSITLKSPAANGSGVIYLGTTSGVASSNGYALEAGDSIDIDIGDAGAIHAIASSGTLVLCKAEVS